MTRLEIDPDDLMLALTWSSENLDYRYYLDSETGAVLLDAPVLDELPEDFGDDPLHLYRTDRIPPRLRSHAGFRRQPARRTTGPGLADALDGRKPFRHFKDALLDYPEVRENWFRNENDFEMRQAAEWCEERDIEPVWRRKMGGG